MMRWGSVSLATSTCSGALSRILLIAVGGAAGALLRYWAQQATHALLGRGFPFGTLLVNVAGSFLMGFLYVYLVERVGLSQELRLALLVGLLGAFTTFSTFSFETLALIEDGESLKALINVVASVGLCLLGCWLGLGLGRQL